MKRIVKFTALALLAAVCLNVLNVQAYAVMPKEFCTGATADATSGVVSVHIQTFSAPAAEAQIAVSLSPVVNDGTGFTSRTGVNMVTVPAMGSFSSSDVQTTLHGRNCWVYVVTDLGNTNQIKSYFVR